MASYQKHWSGRTSRASSGDYFNQKRRLLYGAGRSKAYTLNRNRPGILRRVVNLFSNLRPSKKSGRRSLWKIFGIAVLICILFALGAFAYYSKDLPDPNKLTVREIPQSTKIYDRNGELLYNIFGEAKRTLIDFDQMPKVVKDATIAIEDKDFYKHGGVDFTRIISSAIFDVVTFSKRQGASTITQQFVKNALLTNEKSWGRKIKEVVLAIEIEQKYTKDEILKLYLNEIPYGNNAYGIQAAAQTYFNKNAWDLDLAEAAYLAALPQSPTFYSPWGPNRDRLEARKNTVLQVMKDQGYITEDQRKTATAEKVVFPSVRNAITAPHFVLYIQGLLAQKYGEKTLEVGGLQVTTTLDSNMQRAAEAAIMEYGDKNEKNFDAKNAALVAIDPATGQILAMVGSRNFFDEKNDGQVNVALRPRQPGSSFKPYVYATAFKQGYAPATMLMDVTTNFGNFGGEDYIPQNYTGKNYGPVSMRQALAGSLNVPAVKTILLAGVKESINTAHDLGITTLNDESRYGPSLVLGGGEVTLLDHVSAFGTFASGGIRKTPIGILKVTDGDGKTLEEYQDKIGQQVLDPQIAYLITSILSDNTARTFVFGAYNYLTLPDRSVAAKTGTTQEFRDAWTIGFVPQLAAGVWVGNNDNTVMKKGADGSAVAAPIWNAFMKAALASKPALPFARPDNIRDIAVDSVSGKLPTAYTPSTKPEIFASFALPKDYDDLHVPIKLDKFTQKVATDSTPPQNIVEKVFTIFHSEKPNDPAWEQPVRDWAVAAGYPYPDGYSGSATANNPVYISLNQPTEGQVINSLPLTIDVLTSSQSVVTNVAIYFDDKEIFSNDSPAVKFFYSEPATNGEHTLRIEAKNKDGVKGFVTRKIIYQVESLLSP
ncbi:MAG: penicillin-binding protein [Patescibacteria group bacterium]|nr:penicillin-binding protein [Patescibacteria group bacterium]